MNQTTDIVARPRRGGRRLGAAVLLASATTVLGLGAAAPALASGTLSATPAECTSYGAHGVQHMACSSVVSGGTSPYSYLWKLERQGYVYQESTAEVAQFTCTTGYTYSVALTVTDSAGQTVQTGTGTVCGQNPT